MSSMFPYITVRQELHPAQEPAAPDLPAEAEAALTAAAPVPVYPAPAPVPAPVPAEGVRAVPIRISTGQTLN